MKKNGKGKEENNEKMDKGKGKMKNVRGKSPKKNRLRTLFVCSFVHSFVYRFLFYFFFCLSLSGNHLKIFLVYLIGNFQQEKAKITGKLTLAHPPPLKNIPVKPLRYSAATVRALPYMYTH